MNPRPPCRLARGSFGEPLRQPLDPQEPHGWRVDGSNVATAGYVDHRQLLGPGEGPVFPKVPRVVLGTGFCGAYTTFSTFTFETVRLLEEGGVAEALRNAAGSLLAGSLAAAAILAAGYPYFFAVILLHPHRAGIGQMAYSAAAGVVALWSARRAPCRRKDSTASRWSSAARISV